MDMDSNNQNVEPPEPKAFLEFGSHNGQINCPQPRTATPGPRFGDGNRVACYTSFFPLGNASQKLIVDTIVAGFNTIQKNMCPILAGEMVKFLVDAWKEENKPRSHHGNPPAAHPYYKRLQGLEGNCKNLSYAYWFYMAAWWGPDHPQLRSIRKDMSKLWGVDFPKNTIIYPGNMSVQKQKDLFRGMPTALSDEANGQKRNAEKKPNDNAIPLDTAMQVRVRQLKQTIESTPVEGLAGAIGELPIMLSKVSAANDTSEVEELKRQLAVTRKDLKETLDQVEGLQQELTNLRISTDNRLDQIQRDINEANEGLKIVDEISSNRKADEEVLGGRVDGWEEKLANMDKRVEKAMETCALVLGILSAPGGEKRKHDDEA